MRLMRSIGLAILLGLYLFGGQASAQDAPAGASLVKVGAYINDVQAIDLKANNYVVDFYLWFLWDNADIDPSNTVEFVNHSESWGTIITKAAEEPETLADGRLYQVMHVQGRMSRKMDLRNYPLDRQSIVILVEDIEMPATEMTYVVDSVAVNPELKLPGFQYAPPLMTAADYAHPTDFGEGEGVVSYSRLTIELPIARPVINSMIKNLLPIFLTVFCCSFVFLMHPHLVDARFQIAIFSIFAVIALQITTNEDLPTVEYMTLLDILYLVAYGFCIAVIGALVLSTKLSRAHAEGTVGRPEGLARAIRFDRQCGIGLLALYALLNAVFIARAFWH